MVVVKGTFFVISIAAERAGMHPQTLRMYERKGLINPTRTSGGSRRYSERDIARLRRVQELTATGLNLEGVRRVIELEEQVERLQSELTRAQEEAALLTSRHRRELVPFKPLSTTIVRFSSRK